MRILFLTHYFPPEVNAPASRVYEMARRWVRAGADVTVLTCAPNAPSGRLFPGYKNRLWQRETIDGIQVVRVWTFLAANKGTVLRVMNYLSYMFASILAAPLIKRPDVVIATTPQFFCGWAGVFASMIHRRPLVLEIRDLWAESITTVQAVKKDGRFARWLEALEMRLYRSTPYIITVGPGYRQRLAEKGLDVSRLPIVSNGVDLEFYQPRDPDPQLRRELGLEGKFVCTYAGTIGMSHRLEVVLDAAEILQRRGDDSIRFVIAGDGAEREQLEEGIRKRQLNNVLMLGRQPKEMMPRLYAISDCCLVHLRKAPLYTTVLPSKIFEILAMRRPIILGVQGYTEELLREADAALFMEPENEHELLAAIRQLAESPEEGERLAGSGRRFVVQNFDRDTLAMRYLELLGDVLAGRRWAVQDEPMQCSAKAM